MRGAQLMPPPADTGQGHCSRAPRPPRKKNALFTYTLKFLDVIVGEYVCFLQVLVRVQGSPTSVFQKEGRGPGKGDICRDGDPVQLAQEVQQLLLPVGDGAGVRMYLPWKPRQGRGMDHRGLWKAQS